MKRRIGWIGWIAALTACGEKDETDTGTAACDASSPATLADCVDEARIAADLEALAVPRPPDSAGWQAAQDLCASRLESYGYDVEKYDFGSGIDVIGTRAGTGPAVVISAHYDGVEGCNDADDNASGIAGLLEAARVLAKGTTTAPLVMACWDREEDGLLGSAAYADRLAAAGDSVAVSLVFEMIGYYTDEEDSQDFPEYMLAVASPPLWSQRSSGTACV